MACRALSGDSRGVGEVLWGTMARGTTQYKYLPDYCTPPRRVLDLDAQKRVRYLGGARLARMLERGGVCYGTT